MSIPEEYIRKEKDELPDIEDLKITIWVLKRKAEEIADEMLGKSYKLFVNERNWLGIDGNMSMERETLTSGIDLRKYIGHDVMIKEIITAKNTQTVIIAKVDIKG